MDDLVRALSEFTRSPRWPDRWMSQREFHEELDDRRFWERFGLSAWSEEGRANWLGRALRAEAEPGRAVWLRIGGRYKHFALVALNRQDVNDYIEWTVEVRRAAICHADELVRGEARFRPAALHPLAPPAQECLERAEELACDVIALLPDAQVAARVCKVWRLYEERRPADPLAGLRVCRLVFATALLVLEDLRGQGLVLGHAAPEPLRRLERLAREADGWVNSLLCDPGAEPDEAELESA